MNPQDQKYLDRLVDQYGPKNPAVALAKTMIEAGLSDDSPVDWIQVWQRAEYLDQPVVMRQISDPVSGSIFERLKNGGMEHITRQDVDYLCRRIAKLEGLVEKGEACAIENEAIKLVATAVMKKLEEHGPSIVPHLVDTDENDGEMLRKLIGMSPHELEQGLEDIVDQYRFLTETGRCSDE